MNIKGLDKVEVLRVLYDRAQAQGSGFLQEEPGFLSREEAEKLLSATLALGSRFDYLKGRVMKINLTKDEVDTRLYNRDNGMNAAEDAVAALRNEELTRPATLDRLAYVLQYFETAVDAAPENKAEHLLESGLEALRIFKELTADPPAIDGSYVEDNRVVLLLENGCSIESPGDDDYASGAEVTVFDRNGFEIGHWVSDEWKEDPVHVMGAILRCAALGKKV